LLSVPDVIPLQPGQQVPPGLPSQARDQSDVMGEVELQRLAKRTHEFHKKGLESMRLRHLTAEKYMIHVDGEGQAQWYDIWDGTRIKIMPVLNGFSPTQDNQLRPILDNFIAHLTTQPYRFVVTPKPDRKSRQCAIIDQAIINADCRSQKWNYLTAQAKAIAAVLGFCPVHSMWREDQGDDLFEAAWPGQVPGHIDSFVGNAFDFVQNAGATRGSAHRRTWGRTLPASLVRAAFGRPDLEGTDKMPSASSFQRAIRKWIRQGGIRHGHSEFLSSTEHEEMIALIYDETLAGYDPDYPDGSLCITALQGVATTRPEEARHAIGSPTHLWSGPLPGGVFSAVLMYSHHRFDDWTGKPYVGDIDDDQVELNQRLAILKDYMRRASKPELGASGGVNVDTIGPEGDTFFEVEQLVGGGSGADLQWLQFPNAHVAPLLEEIRGIYERMYRKAGWQAASRGEQTQGSGKAIIALQQADDSIMGPISQRTSEELEDLARLNWRLRKAFMTTPTVLEGIGSELGHLIEPYVDSTMMSDSPPQYQLVSKFGTSTEAIAQQLLNLIGVADLAGEPVLTTRQFKKQWPDQSLYHEVDDPRDVRERRPRVVNEMIRQSAEKHAEQLVQQMSQQPGFIDPASGQPKWQPSMSDPFTQQLGLIVEMEVAQQEDVLMDDDMALNIETLSIITQDPTEHPVARRAAERRQMRYMMWLAGQQQQAQAQQAQQVGAETQAKEQAKGGAPGAPARPGAEEAFNPAAEGGTTTAQGMVQADKQFSRAVA